MGAGCAAVGGDCNGYIEAEGGTTIQCSLDIIQGECLGKHFCEAAGGVDVKSTPSQVWSTNGNSWLIYTTRVTDPGYQEISSGADFTNIWKQLTGGSMAIQFMFRKYDNAACGSTMVFHSYCESDNFNNDRFSSSGRRRNYGSNKCEGGSATPNDQQWHRMVMNAKKRSDGKQDYVIYIDGTQHKSGQTDDVGTIAMDGQLCFGGGHLDRVTTFQLSKLAIFNRELSNDEITGANQKCLSASNGLVAYYPLDGDLTDKLGGRPLDPGYKKDSAARDLTGTFVAASSTNYPTC